MRNQFRTTVEVTRSEICDLILACSAARRCASDEGEKWKRLRAKLKEQLNDLDEQLDMIEA